MSTPNQNWYSHLVAQSRNDNIYSLIHNFLTPEWEPNHHFDFMVVHQDDLPASLGKELAKHLSRKLPVGQYCFSAPGYFVLHNYKLTEYLYHATWAKMLEDLEGNSFILLRYQWTEEAARILKHPPAYSVGQPPIEQQQQTIAIQQRPPSCAEEEALIEAYDLLQKCVERDRAMLLADKGKAFLDNQPLIYEADAENALQQLTRKLMGYNIVAMVYAWNNKIDMAAEVDSLYIHHPPMWQYIADPIKTYLEMLMAKSAIEYLKHLFSEQSFRQRFQGHYEAYMSLFVDETFPLSRMTQVINIINRVNNGFEGYR